MVLRRQPAASRIRIALDGTIRSAAGPRRRPDDGLKVDAVGAMSQSRATRGGSAPSPGTTDLVSMTVDGPRPGEATCSSTRGESNVTQNPIVELAGSVLLLCTLNELSSSKAHV